ncbi:hypothetical protein OPV22_033362 [Ensete ventricosum]|uniref:Uncharacterized protein n=1 Tax=Ensete ventricosum TaxID=4639 RepID=A0AAV8P0V7_ENSVE|nr:hypothetical protein OPV22_033362 [Ensete ventricosum]
MESRADLYHFYQLKYHVQPPVSVTSRILTRISLDVLTWPAKRAAATLPQVGPIIPLHVLVQGNLVGAPNLVAQSIFCSQLFFQVPISIGT